MDDLMLEQFVERAAALTTYPPTPALRARVVAVIAQANTPPARWRQRRAIVVSGLAVIAFAVVAVALAVPSSRSAIAGFFGVEGSKIERLPTPAPGVTPTPLPPAAALPPTARRVTLAEAENIVGFPLALQAGLPLAVYVATYGSESVGIVRYGTFDLWEMRPRDVFLGKGLPEGVVERDTTVGGRPGYWIEGGPHVAYLFDQRGQLPGSERTVARDTLIWRTDFALYRMETSLSLADATRIAETLP